MTDGREGVSDFMSDASRQFAERVQFQRLRKLREGGVILNKNQRIGTLGGIDASK